MIHIAGGIQNQKTTSYLNCTLQILLHFYPFIQFLEDDSLQQEELVKIFKILVKNSSTTENSISPDSLISFFRIDPSIFVNIWQFINDLYEKLPSALQSLIGLFDLQNFSEPTQFNNLISDSVVSKIIENDSFKILLFHITPNSQHSLFLDEQLNIKNKTFQLFSFIQIFKSTSNGQYTIMVRDSEGWILCNDTSVTVVSDSEQARIRSLDLRIPIEVVAYVDSLDSVHFDRRPVRFPPKKTLFTTSFPVHSQFHSSQNDDDDVSEIGCQKPPRISPTNMYQKPPRPSSLFEENSSSDSCDSAIDEIKKEQGLDKLLIGKFYDGKVMRIIDEESIELDTMDYKNAADTLKIHFEEKHNATLSYKFWVNNKFVNAVFKDHTDVSAIYMRSNMAFFFDNLLSESNLVTVEFVVFKTPIRFSGKFTVDQTVKDLESYVETFQNIILMARSQPIYIFLMRFNKAFKVASDMRIKEIQNIIGTNIDLKFGISLGIPNPSQLFSLTIPIYQTKDNFELLKTIEHPICIQEKVFLLIRLVSKNIRENDLILASFDSVNNTFCQIDEKEFLFNIIDNSENLRIQPKMKNDDILFVPFGMPDVVPFYYSPGNADMRKLASRVKNYLNLDYDVKLIYNKHSNSATTPARDYQKGLFDYIKVQRKD